MVTTTVAGPISVAEERRIVLPRVGWETYERLLADDEERRVPRLTYDRGVLELVCPSMAHEEAAYVLGLVVAVVAEELGIDFIGVGSTTYKRKDLDRGFEPDASFYVQHDPHVCGRRQIDLTVDPPPDQAIEIELSSPVIPKLPLFAAFGVPEVWRTDGAAVAILRLEGATYREAAASGAIPR